MSKTLEFFKNDLGRLCVWSPFHEDVRANAKRLGGWWDKNLQCYVYLSGRHDEVLELYDSLFDGARKLPFEGSVAHARLEAKWASLMEGIGEPLEEERTWDDL